jgi:oligosaccharide repeat unit polymerase
MHNNVFSRRETSILVCFGLLATYLLLPTDRPTSIYSAAAIGVMVSVGGGLFLESGGKLRSLIRADALMLVALYGLTLVEFFFPQEEINGILGPEQAMHGVEALFLGFAGLIIGRNFVTSAPRQVARIAFVQLTPNALFILYVVAFCGSYFYMLLAVDFDPAELIREMIAPRWTQEWSRGALGGWQDLLATLSPLVLYLIPAIAGCILADWRRYSAVQLTFVVLGVAFTFFYTFAAGTRNIFAINVVLLLGSYIMTSEKIAWRRIAVLFALTAGVLYFSAYYMLQFRQVGIDAYLQGQGDAEEFESQTLFIDNNLPVISRLTEVFPEQIPYLGLEMASYALLLPVPRALWPDKPTKLSVDAADALGARGLTVSSTFVGESYMMGGYPAVLMVALLFGWLAGWWDRIGRDLRSNLGIIMYASGFLAAVSSMRSFLFTTTTLLPTFALWLYMKSREVRTRPQIVHPKA